MSTNGNQRGIEAMVNGHDPSECLDRAKAHAQAAKEYQQALRVFEQAVIKFEKTMSQPVETPAHNSMVEFAKRNGD